MDIAYTKHFQMVKEGIQGLMRELQEAQKHGDDVKHQMHILNQIINKMNLLMEERPEPWRAMGISRSTWYRDQQRAGESINIKRQYK